MRGRRVVRRDERPAKSGAFHVPSLTETSACFGGDRGGGGPYVPTRRSNMNLSRLRQSLVLSFLKTSVNEIPFSRFECVRPLCISKRKEKLIKLQCCCNHIVIKHPKKKEKKNFSLSWVRLHSLYSPLFDSVLLSTWLSFFCLTHCLGPRDASSPT